MDFNGIKKILLICFICFNVYLWSVWVNERNHVSFSNNVSVTIQQQLEERGIRFKAQAEHASPEQLPLLVAKKSSVLRQLGHSDANSAINIQGEHVKYTLNHPLSIGIELPEGAEFLSEEMLQVIREKFVERENYIMQGQVYTNPSYSPLEKILTFYQATPNGKSIVDGSAEIRLFFNDDSQIVEYTQSYKEDIVEIAEFSPLMSSERALQILDQRVETYLPNDSTVLLVDLSYARLHELDNLDVYTPVWRVVYERQDGSVRTKLVDAIRGNVVGTQH